MHDTERHELKPLYYQLSIQKEKLKIFGECFGMNILRSYVCQSFYKKKLFEYINISLFAVSVSFWKWLYCTVVFFQSLDLSLVTLWCIYPIKAFFSMRALSQSLTFHLIQAKSWHLTKVIKYENLGFFMTSHILNWHLKRRSTEINIFTKL